MRDVHTAIVALTHDPKLDDMALLEAPRSGAFYVGGIVKSEIANARIQSRWGSTSIETEVDQ